MNRRGNDGGGTGGNTGGGAAPPELGDVTVPELGEGVEGAVVVRWLKGDGEAVAAGEGVVELETDKASVEVPAPASGVLRARARPGDAVGVGQRIAAIRPAAPAPPRPPGVVCEVVANEVGFSAIRLSEWVKREGELVRAGETVAMLSTRLGSPMAVEAPAAGVLRPLAAADSPVGRGAVIAHILDPDAATALPPPPPYQDLHRDLHRRLADLESNAAAAAEAAKAAGAQLAARDAKIAELAERVARLERLVATDDAAGVLPKPRGPRGGKA